MDRTEIQWTDSTWNPVRGCSRVSAGCENCYAEKIAKRFSGPGKPYEGLVNKHGAWNGTMREVPEHLFDPLRWTKPRMVFVNSMSDLFHEGVADEYIAAVFGVMAAAPQHTFQILTKRPERARYWFDRTRTIDEIDAARTTIHDDDGPGTPGRLECLYRALVAEAEHHPKGDGGPLHTKHAADPVGPWPLPNVWLGVSAENQEAADERIPILLDTPAAVRFVSAEPLLEAVDFDSPVLRHHYRPGHTIDWIIIGGESGPGARPCNVQWIRSIVQQCREAGVPCFVKQLGARAVGLPRPSPGDVVVRRDRKGGDPTQWPEDLRVREMGSGDGLTL